MRRAFDRELMVDGRKLIVEGNGFAIEGVLTVRPPHPSPLPRKRGRGDKNCHRQNLFTSGHTRLGQRGEMFRRQTFGAIREAKEGFVSLRAVVSHELKQLKGGVVEG